MTQKGTGMQIPVQKSDGLARWRKIDLAAIKEEEEEETAISLSQYSVAMFVPSLSWQMMVSRRKMRAKTVRKLFFSAPMTRVIAEMRFFGCVAIIIAHTHTQKQLPPRVELYSCPKRVL